MSAYVAPSSARPRQHRRGGVADVARVDHRDPPVAGRRVQAAVEGDAVGRGEQVGRVEARAQDRPERAAAQVLVDPAVPVPERDGRAGAAGSADRRTMRRTPAARAASMAPSPTPPAAGRRRPRGTARRRRRARRAGRAGRRSRRARRRPRRRTAPARARRRARRRGRRRHARAGIARRASRLAGRSGHQDHRDAILSRQIEVNHVPQL